MKRNLESEKLAKCAAWVLRDMFAISDDEMPEIAIVLGTGLG